MLLGKPCAEMGVRVDAVLPGITKTRFDAALRSDEALLSQYLKHVPMVAQPDEVAGAVLYSRLPQKLRDGRLFRSTAVAW